MSADKKSSKNGNPNADGEPNPDGNSSSDIDLFARPKQRPFNKRYREMRLSPERARRQWHIVNLAYALLGDRDATMSFLNPHNGSLGERPLDLAMKNAAGYAAVESAIRLLARPQYGRVQ
jgi:hypothetical protein